MKITIKGALKKATDLRCFQNWHNRRMEKIRECQVALRSRLLRERQNAR